MYDSYTYIAGTSIYMKSDSLLKYPNDYYHGDSQECISHYYVQGRLILIDTIELRANVRKMMSRFLFLLRLLNFNSFSHQPNVYD